MVASVHQQDGLALIHVALLHGSDSGIGQFGRLVVDVGVDIVGVQDGDSGILARQETGRSLRNGSSHGGGSGGDTGSLQEIAARNKVFHKKDLLYVPDQFLRHSLSSAVPHSLF